VWRAISRTRSPVTSDLTLRRFSTINMDDPEPGRPAQHARAGPEVRSDQSTLRVLTNEQEEPVATMKILVDYDLCEANAKCMQVCPEVFEVDDDDNLILHKETVDDSLKAKVEEAIRICPRQALALADD